MTKQFDDEFDWLGTFAHDVKNPLSAVKGYIDLIEQTGTLNERQSYFANRAIAGIDRIVRKIQEYLDFVRLETTAEIQIEDCDIIGIVDEAIYLLDDVIRQKRVTITQEIHPEASVILSSQQLLHHILFNLINNGIKYNRMGGEVRIIIKAVQEEVVMTIEDTGIGIPEDEVDFIFQRFYRATRSHGERIEGSGLGLYIVRALVERLGGKISVVSVLDEGSSFTVNLPFVAVSGSSSQVGLDAAELHDAIDDHTQEGRDEYLEE